MRDRGHDLRQSAEAFIEAFNAGDWARFGALLDPDVAYEETGTQRRVRGAAAYLQLCQGWKEAFPDGQGTIRQVVDGGETVVQELTWAGTHTGPLAGPAGTMPPSERRIAVPATIWLRFRGGKIVEVRHHLDLMTMLQQVGAFPAPPQS